MCDRTPIFDDFIILKINLFGESISSGPLDSLGPRLGSPEPLGGSSGTLEFPGLPRGLHWTPGWVLWTFWVPWTPHWHPLDPWVSPLDPWFPWAPPLASPGALIASSGPLGSLGLFCFVTVFGISFRKMKPDF